MEAMTGFGMLAICKTISRPASRSLRKASTLPFRCRPAMNSTSPPAQNARPAPVITTTRHDFSPSATRSASTNSSRIAPAKAFSLSGRSRVMMVTWSRKMVEIDMRDGVYPATPCCHLLSGAAEVDQCAEATVPDAQRIRGPTLPSQLAESDLQRVAPHQNERERSVGRVREYVGRLSVHRGDTGIRANEKVVQETLIDEAVDRLLPKLLGPHVAHPGALHEAPLIGADVEQRLKLRSQIARGV